MLTLACGAAAFVPMPIFGRGRAQPSSAFEMSAGAPAAAGPAATAGTAAAGVMPVYADGARPALVTATNNSYGTFRSRFW